MPQKSEARIGRSFKFFGRSLFSPFSSYALTCLNGHACQNAYVPTFYPGSSSTALLIGSAFFLGFSTNERTNSPSNVGLYVKPQRPRCDYARAYTDAPRNPLVSALNQITCIRKLNACSSTHKRDRETLDSSPKTLRRHFLLLFSFFFFSPFSSFSSSPSSSFSFSFYIFFFLPFFLRSITLPLSFPFFLDLETPSCLSTRLYFP